MLSCLKGQSYCCHNLLLSQILHPFLSFTPFSVPFIHMICIYKPSPVLDSGLVPSLVEISESDQIRSVAQSCPTLCDPMSHSTPGLPVHHQLLEFTQTHVHRVSDAIQPSHPLSFPSLPAPNPSQHQGLFQ